MRSVAMRDGLPEGKIPSSSPQLHAALTSNMRSGTFHFSLCVCQYEISSFSTELLDSSIAHRTLVHDCRPMSCCERHTCERYGLKLRTCADAQIATKVSIPYNVQYTVVWQNHCTNG
jgi:hypothetical protein